MAGPYGHVLIEEFVLTTRIISSSLEAGAVVEKESMHQFVRFAPSPFGCPCDAHDKGRSRERGMRTFWTYLN